VVEICDQGIKACALRQIQPLPNARLGRADRGSPLSYATVVALFLAALDKQKLAVQLSLLAYEPKDRTQIPDA
jgi:hypothetical protein